MQKINWNEVMEATGSTKLEPGAYIIKITAIEDEPQYERLKVVFDVIEGPKTGIYAGMGPDDNWKHQFTQKYSQKAQPFFKAFLRELERDNPGFSIDTWAKHSDEKELVGLKLGMLFRDYYYINNSGDPKCRQDGYRPISIADVKSGNWTMPEPSFQYGTDASDYASLLVPDAQEVDVVVAATQPSMYSDVPF